MATGWRAVRPAALNRVGGETIQAGSVNKAPVLKTNVQASKEPVRSIGVFIGGQGTRNFALVSKVTKVLGSLVSFHIV